VPTTSLIKLNHAAQIITSLRNKNANCTFEPFISFFLHIRSLRTLPNSLSFLMLSGFMFFYFQKKLLTIIVLQVANLNQS